MKMQRNSIHFLRPDDETLEIVYVGAKGTIKPIAYATHDAHGWSGMDEIEKAVRGVASAVGIHVVES